jgi:hypothetical protein
MQKNDLRSQNDNSKEYRENRLKQTEKLLKKSLLYIYESDKNFSHKNICTVMQLLATDEDKALRAVISPSAISKNKHYKQIIETYQIQNEIFRKKQNKLHLTEGDLAFQLHKCKTALAQKSDEVKVLKHIMEKEKFEMKEETISINKDFYDYKYLLKEVYQLILKDGLAFIDGHGNMVLEDDQMKVVATKNLLDELSVK